MEKRPDFWVGHVSLGTTDLKGSKQFLEDLGLRHEFDNRKQVIMELRGGTHIIMSKKAGLDDEDAYFDLMVEDVDAAYRKLRACGYPVTDIQRGSIHDTFTVTEPGGNRIRVNSSHVRDHSIV